jgi:hypothetical protein
MGADFWSQFKKGVPLWDCRKLLRTLGSTASGALVGYANSTNFFRGDRMASRQVRFVFDAPGCAWLRRIAVRDGTSVGGIIRRIVKAYLRSARPPAPPTLVAILSRRPQRQREVALRVWFQRDDYAELDRLAEQEETTVTWCVRAIVSLYLESALRAGQSSGATSIASDDKQTNKQTVELTAYAGDVRLRT